MEVIPISRLHIILYFYNSQCQINSLQEREEVESTTADHQKDNETPEVSLKAAPRHNPHHILAQLIASQHRPTEDSFLSPLPPRYYHQASDAGNASVPVLVRIFNWQKL